MSLLLVACGEEEQVAGECSVDADCGDTTIYYCDKVHQECKVRAGVDLDQIGGTDEGNDNTGGTDDDQGGTTDSVQPDDDAEPVQDIDYAGLDCVPGTTEKCPYNGPSGTEDVGLCKAAVKLCKESGTWGNCNGEVLPVYEICDNGIDEDCTGTPDDGDIDGDGYSYCGPTPDCCEDTSKCPDPAAAYPGATELPNGADDDCDGNIDNGVSDCDDTIALDSKNPFDYAKSMGLCNGVVQADILKLDGSANPHINSNGLLSAFGNVITPKQGVALMALSSGKVGNPVTDLDFNQNIGGLSGTPVPGDWYAANGNQFPSSPACSGGSGTTGGAFDGVMVQFKVQVPPTANSFSFNIYFFTKEYPTYICSNFNDFFIALLDSGYNTSAGADPNLLNPQDKNLAMDADGNPVGINIAPAGLFKQCVNQPSQGVTSCVGTEELQGTGFEAHGATGWLTTRGNVVPGETITLRFAIWDLSDHVWDSMVLIDNFQWQSTNFKPGTGDS